MSERRLLLLAVLVTFQLSGSSRAVAQYDDPAEAFLGFSRLSLQPGRDLPDEGLRGWYGGVAGYVAPWLGFAVDLSGHYGSVSLPSNAAGLEEVDVNQHSVLFGPQFRILRTPRLAASIHALIGMSRGKADVNATPSEFDFHFAGKQTKLAGAVGFSVDFNLNEAIAWRIVQPDLFVTSFGGGQQNNFRLATGLVVRFGSRWP